MPPLLAQRKMNGKKLKQKILILLNTSNLFETCFMLALKGETTHFTGFYTHTISGPKILKPAQCYAKRRNSHGHHKCLKKHKITPVLYLF